jgi:hypothetical protein
MADNLTAVLLLPQIQKAAGEHKVWWDVIAAIISHESNAMERRAANYAGNAGLGLVGFVVGRFVDYADLAERAQVKLKGDSASIGIGQMQVSWAKRLRNKYPTIIYWQSVVDDLLDREVAVGYVAAGLRELREQLDALLAQHNVTLRDVERQDLVALGYNIGWDNLRDRNLLASDMGPDIPSRVAAIRKQSKYIKLTTERWRNL